MIDHLPTEIVWRKDKVGFEPPQKQWMEDKRVQDLIYEARKVLVNEKIIKEESALSPCKATLASMKRIILTGDILLLRFVFGKKRTVPPAVGRSPDCTPMLQKFSGLSYQLS